jgi:hypothetical protein
MQTNQSAPRSAAADVAQILAGAWPLDAGMDGARTLAAVAGTTDPAAAAVSLAAQMAGVPPRSQAGGARRLTREYSYLLSSYTAESCEPLPVFNTLRGAGVAGDEIRHAQPGIQYVLLVRDRGTLEWRTAVGCQTITEAIAHHWPAS